jgi:hypothetical protein
MRPAVANRALSEQVIRNEGVPKAASSAGNGASGKWTAADSVRVASFRKAHISTNAQPMRRRGADGQASCIPQLAPDPGAHFSDRTQSGPFPKAAIAI